MCVCLVVCPQDNFRTIKGRSNLAVRYVVQKSRPNSKVKVKGQGRQGQKTAQPSPFTMHSRACAVARTYAASSNRRYHCVATGYPGVTSYPGGKISACCLVFVAISVIELIFVQQCFNTVCAASHLKGVVLHLAFSDLS